MFFDFFRFFSIFFDFPLFGKRDNCYEICSKSYNIFFTYVSPLIELFEALWFESDWRALLRDFEVGHFEKLSMVQLRLDL